MINNKYINALYEVESLSLIMLQKLFSQKIFFFFLPWASKHPSEYIKEVIWELKVYFKSIMDLFAEFLCNIWLLGKCYSTFDSACCLSTLQWFKLQTDEWVSRRSYREANICLVSQKMYFFKLYSIVQFCNIPLKYIHWRRVTCSQHGEIAGIAVYLCCTSEIFVKRQKTL